MSVRRHRRDVYESGQMLCRFVDIDESGCLRIGTNEVSIRRHRRIGMSTNVAICESICYRKSIYDQRADANPPQMTLKFTTTRPRLILEEITHLLALQICQNSTLRRRELTTNRKRPWWCLCAALGTRETAVP